MENETIVSHKVDTICKNVRSQRRKLERCVNQATHGDFCGHHYKKPTPWVLSSNKSELELKTEKVKSAKKILEWYRRVNGIFRVRQHGIGYWIRSIATNDSDFFSTDSIQDISGIMFFSYIDPHQHVYAFDIRSIHSLYNRANRANESAVNPFTREEFPEWLESKKNRLIANLIKRNLPIEWIPTQPPTPEQQWRMRVVDLFHKIDNLNYYSSPDWFIGLSAYGHAKYYRELHDIWTFRAGLNNLQKNTIVPNHSQRLFKHSPWLVSEQPIETIQKINMNAIRLLISSAADRNDQILGAMYVITAFTLVNRQARIAYPWLYESVTNNEDVTPIIQQEVNTIEPFANIFGIHWLQALMQDSMPSLNLGDEQSRQPE